MVRSIRSNIIFIILLLYFKFRWLLSLTQRIKTARISPRTIASVPGITISTGPGVSVLSDLDIWNFEVITQYGVDMQIKLDSTWGFDANYPSTLQLYIQGATSTQTYNDDGEILFMFAVGDNYFAQMISLDRRKSTYKECPRSFEPLINRNLDEMIGSVSPDRYHRFCKNAVSVAINDALDEWDNVSSFYKQSAQWPMTITITNDPLANTTSYTWTDSMIIPNKVSSHYTSAIAANEGISIYLSGESPNEDFQIFSIDAIYQYTHIPTATPTNAPTMEPSPYPSFHPTVSPTLHPTNGPSIYPTAYPTGDYAVVNITSEENVFDVVENQSDIGPVSWFHALIIIGAFLTILIVWVTIFGFVYYKKRMRKNRNKNENDRGHKHQKKKKKESEKESELARPESNSYQSNGSKRQKREK